MFNVIYYLSNIFWAGFQFSVPFKVAECREFDKRVLSRYETKSIGIQGETATFLLIMIVASVYSYFIAIRLVEGEYAYTLFAFVIDFALYLRTTLTDNNLLIIGIFNGNNRFLLIGTPMFHYINVYSTEEDYQLWNMNV